MSNPLTVAAGAEDAFWSTVDDWADNTSRLTLLHETADFRHYAAATRVWGFVDDVTISLDRITGEVVMHPNRGQLWTWASTPSA